ncbi:MAG: lactate racemase domain-containing protein [candidate division KSB1 bacterium]|nr:lactate racemase domain-containing protein [candidate division KSB1 bacterium]MDZ7304662.1 lactate racemase domain-containing protein [candidate division KSB1 bacterium]MDZ7313806.1 lactate racemase domain-containing protein [candidate division KSB1 bacterium]
MDTTIGKGSLQTPLTESEVREICTDALSSLALEGKRVLVLIPDHTRHAPVDLFFHLIYKLLGQKVKALDYLIATGTHQAMSMERIYQHVGITAREHKEKYAKIRFFNHEHDNPAALATIGTIPAAEIYELSNGLFNEEVKVTINKRVLEYDQILMITPVVPHEAMGFAGGNKYFFPGVGGVNIIQTFHWIAALITNPVVNGVKDTPTRKIIDKAAAFIKTSRLCFAFAVNDHHQLACLFAGDPQAAWSRAADYSAQLHINYVDKPYRQILGIAPEIYEEIWVAGKVMYKLEPVVADDGELIIYGPHIREISFVHGEIIKRIGYHVRDYFVKQWDRFRNEPKLILAHSTNVRGIGTFENGVEHPRIAVTLATSIPEEVCRSINLGYRDYRTINLDEWRARQNGDLLVVENAGQLLYRLRN